MLNTLFLAERASFRAGRFLEGLSLVSHKPRLKINLFRALYETHEMRHAFLQGYFAALEELRRASLTRAKTTPQETEATTQ